jgi:aspartate kinase
VTKDIIVQKFGGTSVADIECLQLVMQMVIKTKEAGNNVVVVLSAMAGETDRLINLATSAVENANPNSREYDALISTGEMVSTAMLSLILCNEGYQAKSVNGAQASIKTDAFHKKAQIESIDTDYIHQLLDNDIIPVVTGFQGINKQGDITTLGRGGSDTTGVALAVALEAKECQIYTDVEGVYTADPRVVPAAKHLPQITLEEMLEMASLGSKVLQNRAVRFAGKYKMPLRVLSTFKDSPGTLITYEEFNMEKPVVTGIAFNRSEARLTLSGIPDEPGASAEILGPIADANIDVDMILQNPDSKGCFSFTFTVHRDEYQQAMAILKTVEKQLDGKGIQGDNKIAKVSLIGIGMRTHTGVGNKLFKTLASEGIPVQLVTTSEIKISVVLDEKYLELAARSLHTVFGLDNELVEEFDPAPVTS